jgi:hypothetical protein
VSAIPPATLRTYTDRCADLLLPDPAALEMRDIAHGLAQQCRFAGQIVPFYSVAEHSVHVAAMTRAHLLNPPRPLFWSEADKVLVIRQALLHDASEAYLGDVIAPLKRHPLLEGYRQIEARWMDVIRARYALGAPHPLVERMDILLCDWERHALYWRVAGPLTSPLGQLPTLYCWPPAEAEAQFLSAWAALEREEE